MSFYQKQERKPIQPDFTKEPPKAIHTTRRRDEVLYVAGTGAETPKIMFIGPSATEEDVKEENKSNGGTRTYVVKPRYLSGSYGSVLKSILNGVGIDFYQECYYTTLCKWELPKAQKIKPKPDAVAWGLPALEEEIARLKPKMIVCMGKVVFDALSGIKINHDDARGAWFYNKKYNCQLYLMDDPGKPVYRPYYVEVFRTDALQIRRALDLMEGIEVKTVELNYKVIDNIADLEGWVDQMLEEKHTVFSVDCEWGGFNHVDGDLRSVQFSWKPGYAIYIKFMDETRTYVFDGADYAQAGKTLSRLMDRKETKYVGHHIAADLPWLHTWLGLEWYEKTLLDTEFATQCLDEEAALGLDDLALKYTDLGKYDIDLILWKKSNKMDDLDGYAYVPDDILIPYAMKDVDTVIRSYGNILNQLYRDQLVTYYIKILNPFVTDMFVAFTLLGLPMDIPLMNEMRELYNFCKEKLEQDLQLHVHKESVDELRNKLVSHNFDREVIDTWIDVEKKENIWENVKTKVTAANDLEDIRNYLDHYHEAKTFNIRSAPAMKRWLYGVKKFVPIKSTANKAKGLMATPWEKVLDMDAETQKEYNPAIDKQSLQILSKTYKYELLDKLLRLNAVGNICKQFLKDPIVDENGEVTEERGLFAYFCSDNRVHGQLSTTETGRPRAWKPNILNWPKYVNDNICEGILSTLKIVDAEGKLPEKFAKYLHGGVSIPSIRSCVKAPEGWCLVESDYQTAEVRGLAFISGDEELIRILTKPDKQFGIHKETGKPLRLYYDENSGITPENQDPELLTAHNSEILKKDAEGNLIHPAADLHWSLAEMMYGIPREKLDKEIHRSAAKVGNFQSMYGASETTLERKIEQDTGRKPEPGTGKRILDALARRQPVATQFLLDVEKAPAENKCLVAASGRKRHFATHYNKGVRYSNKYDAKKLNSSMGREARNFYMQESVASTSAKAAKWLLDYYLKNNMQARPMVVLYDSVVTLCPLEERHIVEKLHSRYMTDENVWTYHGVEMNYPIDTEILVRWSTKPTKEEKVALAA